MLMYFIKLFYFKPKHFISFLVVLSIKFFCLGKVSISLSPKEYVALVIISIVGSCLYTASHIYIEQFALFLFYIIIGVIMISNFQNIMTRVEKNSPHTYSV